MFKTFSPHYTNVFVPKYIFFLKILNVHMNFDVPRNQAPLCNIWDWNISWRYPHTHTLALHSSLTWNNLTLEGKQRKGWYGKKPFKHTPICWSLSHIAWTCSFKNSLCDFENNIAIVYLTLWLTLHTPKLWSYMSLLILAVVDQRAGHMIYVFTNYPLWVRSEIVTMLSLKLK